MYLTFYIFGGLCFSKTQIRGQRLLNELIIFFKIFIFRYAFVSTIRQMVEIQSLEECNNTSKYRCQIETDPIII